MAIGFVTIFAVLAVMTATYLMYSVIGTRRHSLLLTADEKRKWDATVVPRLGKPLVIVSLVGTLTSLATAYLFFIGNSKIFGYWVFVCPFSIFLGAVATNLITGRLLKIPHIRSRITGGTQQSGVIARLFWANTESGKRTALAVKWISLMSISGVIWLEFALFGDVFGMLLGVESFAVRAVVCGVATLLVTDFTLRFGLRGFIFADAFHAPLLALATLVLVGATAWSVFQTNPTFLDIDAITSLIAPIVDQKSGILFCGHVILLNAFLVVLSEAHWLRLWALTKDPVMKRQLAGAGSTAFVWLILSICGFLAFTLTHQPGEAGVVSLLQHFSKQGTIVVTVFWLGAAAALFSTADVQIYGLLLVKQFNPRTGELDDRRFDSMPCVWISIIGAAFFGLLYWIVRTAHLPFEKIIFIIIPFTLNLLPAFAALLLGRRTAPIFIYISLAGYLVFAVTGFFQPDSQFFMTLMASIVPFIVSPLVLFTPRTTNENT